MRYFPLDFSIDFKYMDSQFSWTSWLKNRNRSSPFNFLVSKSINKKGNNESFIKNVWIRVYALPLSHFVGILIQRSQLNKKNYCINKWNDGNKLDQNWKEYEKRERETAGKTLLTDFHQERKKNLNETWANTKQHNL